ncbi:CidA/LrgA family protein [Geothermobacter hydrogeniphilus]|uniref:CidA/LrgA family protein n=1 Tax=Geothermobacter hydrogeniphilus TaxID=1969733 RepID=A0A2K2HCJ8_9BACT|nr:CidA/LrgA family protein [Geothermobacter hydrogeniphilus]PNU20961.1 CidA/LrgA family protein [Geothermobacter hydrogeniphilus]
MIRGFAVLLGFQFFGELLSRWSGIPIPGNVIGMALLLAALGCGWVKLAWIEEAAELLLSHLALFFVPAGVGVMIYGGLIAREWLPISIATVVSTFVVMAVTGWVASLLDREGGEHAE